LPIDTLHLYWPLADRAIGPLEVRVECEGPLSFTLGIVGVLCTPAGSTLHQTGLIGRTTFPESAAIVRMRMIVRPPISWINKFSAIRDLTTIIGHAVLPRVVNGRPSGPHFLGGYNT